MGVSPRRAAGPLPASDDFDFWDDLSEDWVEARSEPAEPVPARGLEAENPEDAEDSEKTLTPSASGSWTDSAWTDDPWRSEPLPARAFTSAPDEADDDLFADPFGGTFDDDPRPSRAWVDDAWDSRETDEHETDEIEADEPEVDEPEPPAYAPEPELPAYASEPHPAPATPLAPRHRGRARRSADPGLLQRHGRGAAIVGGVAALAIAGSLLIPGLLPRLDAVPAANAHAASGATPAPDADRTAGDRPARAGERSEPTAAATPAESAQPTAVAKPVAAMTVTNVAGVPRPCQIDMPITDDMSAAEITAATERQWGFDLTGPQWQQNEYRPIVELFAETLDSVDCTGYLDRVKAGNGGRLEISSQSTRSWAWGDYGLTRPGVLTLDFAKFRSGYAEGDRGRLVRLVIHEMAHSLNADRGSSPTYWDNFGRVWRANGPVSSYGSTETESFADAVGYYVARCAADNPYDSTKNRAYYDYVKSNIFDGREFGGAVGTPQTCAIKGR